MRQLKARFDPFKTRTETLDGDEYLVVPVTMIVAGVLNDSLLLPEEFGRYPTAWNGRPVVVSHPEANGTPISASQDPKTFEKVAIGFLFNTRMDVDRLRSEAWINVKKAKARGYDSVLADLKAGKIMEVSTGYFPDEVAEPGEFNGRPYQVIDVNIRPDHLALLPNEVGACSVEDGCGTRINKREAKSMADKTKDAVKSFLKAFGFKPKTKANGCKCEELDIPHEQLVAMAKELHTNEKLSPEQFELIQNMDPEQLAVALTLIKATLDAGEPMEVVEEPEPMEDDEEEGGEARPAMMSKKKEQPKQFTEKDVEKLVNNAMRRNSVLEKLRTYDACPFDDEDLAEMSVKQLEKLEKSYRPVDYSGQGAFSVNSGDNVRPLGASRGVMTRAKKEESK